MFDDAFVAPKEGQTTEVANEYVQILIDAMEPCAR